MYPVYEKKMMVNIVEMGMILPLAISSSKGLSDECNVGELVMIFPFIASSSKTKSS